MLNLSHFIDGFPSPYLHIWPLVLSTIILRTHMAISPVRVGAVPVIQCKTGLPCFPDPHHWHRATRGDQMTSIPYTPDPSPPCMPKMLLRTTLGSALRSPFTQLKRSVGETWHRTDANLYLHITSALRL